MARSTNTRGTRVGSRHVFTPEEKARRAEREKQRQEYLSSRQPKTEGGVTETLTTSTYEESPFIMVDGEGNTHAVSQAEVETEISGGVTGGKAGKNLMILGVAGVAVVGLGVGLWWMNR